MSDNSNIGLRSEQVQEILTKMPHWMIRWGNLIILFIIILVFSFSYFIKYPNIITTKIIITTQVPTEKLIAQSSGKIEKIFVKDRANVNPDTPIMVIKNTAKYRDVFLLKSIVDSISVSDYKNGFNFPFNCLPLLQLGDIQNAFILFETDYSIYNLHRSSIKKQVDKKQSNIKLLKKVLQSFNNLKRAIYDWEFSYVLMSSIKGKISFNKIWSENQIINAGELFLTIIPENYKSYVGRGNIKSYNSGRIKVGQSVNISLDSYPNNEFGIVKGKVKTVALTLNNEGNLLINIELPKGLNTSFHKKVIFRPGMAGKADIITEDLRLIERFFYQFKNIFT